MVAVTPGGGIQDNGRTPTMTIKPALWASALFAWAGINLIAAVDTVLPGGSGQVWAAGLVTAVAAAAGALIVRNMRANRSRAGHACRYRPKGVSQIGRAHV